MHLNEHHNLTKINGDIQHSLVSEEVINMSI